MDKLVLEKLLHLYKLVPQKPNSNLYDGNVMEILPKGLTQLQIKSDSSWNKFLSNISVPRSMKQDVPVLLKPEIARKKLKEFSDEIQRAGKFYYDSSYYEHIISEEDFSKLCQEVPQVLPYESTFLQVAAPHAYYDGMTYNILIKEVTEDSTAIRNAKSHGHFNEANKYFSLTCFTYFHNRKVFNFNPITMHYCLGVHGSVQKDENAITNIDDYAKKTVDVPFTFWIDHECYENKDWQDFYDDSEDENGVLSNPMLNTEVSIYGGMLQMLFVLLAYPQLCKQEEVRGKKPMVFGSMTPFKDSELRRKPTWEHKTLVVNLTQEEKQIIDEARESGVQGKRFHAVRSHVRRLASGKMTIVKSHFRGDKSLGVIQKDYKIK